MSVPPKTAIVTGASQGIGAAIVKACAERGFNVVASSRTMTRSTEVAASDHVALVDGDIGQAATAARIVETALSRFQSIDVLVNNAGSVPCDKNWGVPRDLETVTQHLAMEYAKDGIWRRG